MKTAAIFLIENFIENFGTDMDSEPSEWELKAMDEYANQAKEKAEKRNGELVEALEALYDESYLSSSCEAELTTSGIKLQRMVKQALKNNKHPWAVCSIAESDAAIKKVNKLAQPNNNVEVVEALKDLLGLVVSLQLLGMFKGCGDEINTEIIKSTEALKNNNND